MKWIVFFLLFPFKALSHPGTGIVKDSRNRIYYTDLERVWMISPDGKRTVIIPDVHTHELYMDGEDVLYGENSIYYPSTKTWAYWTWKWSGGKLDTVIVMTPGFRSGYSFTRDRQGNMFRVEKFITTRFIKRSPDGIETTIAERKMGTVHWLYGTEGGDLYFISEGSLHRLQPSGELLVLAKGITADKKDPSRSHSTFGIWTDVRKRVFVADYTSGRVKTVDSSGRVTTYVSSPQYWGPTGGVFDDAGNLWLLECSHQNEIRVRKISAVKSESRQASGLMDMEIAWMVLLLLFAGCFFGGRVFLEKCQRA